MLFIFLTENWLDLYTFWRHRRKEFVEVKLLVSCLNKLHLSTLSFFNNYSK
jgi:hypothetical protein